MRGRGVVWIIVIAIGAIASYFTVSKGDVAKWNDKIVAKYNRFGRAWQAFSPAFEPYLKGQPLDEARVDAAFGTYRREVGQAAGELRRQTPPDDDLCKQFHAEVVRYADLQESQVLDVEKILGDMKASNPGGPDDIAQAAQALDDLGRKEKAMQDVIEARQKSMASKFRLKIR